MRGRDCPDGRRIRRWLSGSQLRGQHSRTPPPCIVFTDLFSQPLNSCPAPVLSLFLEHIASLVARCAARRKLESLNGCARRALS